MKEEERLGKAEILGLGERGGRKSKSLRKTEVAKRREE